MEATDKKTIHKKTKVLIIIISIILVLLLTIGIIVYVLFGNQIKAARSIYKITDNFYSMEYSGSYGFDKFLEQGGASSDAELIADITKLLYHDIYKVNVDDLRFGCSTLTVTDGKSEVLFGRNFDYKDCKAMVVTTKPIDGYASISTCNLKFLGINDKWKEQEFLDQMLAVAAVYVPVDGMNEKGVCIAVLTVSDGTTNQDAGKKDITTTTAVRMILDYAKDVEEAIDLLKDYDMHASLQGQFKFVISDASGKTVSVEYIKNEMYVTDVNCASNFYQTPGEYYGVGIRQPDGRYETLKKAYEDSEGIMEANSLMKTMEKASQKYFYHNHTQWTAVFHTKELYVEYCYHENYEDKYVIHIKGSNE